MFDQRTFGFPQADEVCGAGVVQDGVDGVEIGLDGGTVDFGYVIHGIGGKLRREVFQMAR